ncbi:MAG: aspartate--tRNA(Asn) ligase [Candidatus Bathyarchaeia archaeon]
MLDLIDLRRRVSIREAKGDVVVAGFVHEVRDLKNIVFVILRDSSGLIQITAKKDSVPDEVFELLRKIKRESVIAVEGYAFQSDIAKLGLELKPRRVEVLCEAVEQPAIEFYRTDIIKTGLDKRLRYRFLDLRNPRVAAIFKIQSTICEALDNFFRERGFREVHTSRLVAQATESGANVFPVDYFGRKVFLAQSPQFYKQMLMAAGFEKVFEIGPVFRAEKHHTPRHLCEYVSIDFEMSYIESDEDVMRIVEGMIGSVCEVVSKKCKEELEILNVEVQPIKTPILRLPMREAYKLLESEGFKPDYMEDLNPEGERKLSNIVEREYGYKQFFLTEFPWKPRPFYTMRIEEEPDWTRSFDLIWSGLEVTTGGQREHRYHRLIDQCIEKGLNPEDLSFYLEFFKCGVPPHGGSGTGLERLTSTILKIENIREATLIPRDPERILP